MSFNRRHSEEERRAEVAAKTAVIKSAKPALITELSKQYRLQGLTQQIQQELAKYKIERCDAVIASNPRLQSMQVTEAREHAWEQINCDQRINESPALQARLALDGLDSAREAAWQERICDKTIQNNIDLQSILAEAGLSSAREQAWQMICQEAASSILQSNQTDGLEADEAVAIAQQTLLKNRSAIDLEEQAQPIDNKTLEQMCAEASISGDQHHRRAQGLKGMSLGRKLASTKAELATESSLSSRHFEANALTHYLSEVTGILDFSASQVEKILNTSDHAAYKTVARLLYQSDNFQLGDFYELSKANLSDPQLLDKLVDFRQTIQGLSQLLSLTHSAMDHPGATKEKPALKVLHTELARKIRYTDLVMKAMHARLHYDESDNAINIAEELLESVMINKAGPMVKQYAVSYSHTAASNVYHEGQSAFIKSALTTYLKMSPSEQERVLLDQKTNLLPEVIDNVLSQAMMATAETHQRASEKTIKISLHAQIERQRQEEQKDKKTAYEGIIDRDSNLQDLKDQKKIAKLKFATWSRHLSNELSEKRDTVQIEEGLSPAKAWLKTIPKELISSARSSPEIRKLRAASREHLTKPSTGKREARRFSTMVEQATKSDSNMVRHFNTVMAGYDKLGEARDELKGSYTTVGSIIRAHKDLKDSVKNKSSKIKKMFEKVSKNHINTETIKFNELVLVFLEKDLLNDAVQLHDKARKDNIFSTDGFSSAEAELLSAYESVLKEVFSSLKVDLNILEKAQQTLNQLAGKAIQIEDIKPHEAEDLDSENPCGILLGKGLASISNNLINNHHLSLIFKDSVQGLDVTNKIFSTNFKNNTIKNREEYGDYQKKIGAILEKIESKKQHLSLLENKIIEQFPTDEQEIWNNREQLREKGKNDLEQLESLEKNLVLIQKKVDSNDSVKSASQAYKNYLNKKDDEIKKTPAEIVTLKIIHSKAISDINRHNHTISNRMRDQDTSHQSPFESSSDYLENISENNHLRKYIKKHGLESSLEMEVENNKSVNPNREVVNHHLLEAVLNNVKDIADNALAVAKLIPSISLSSKSSLSSTANILQQLESSQARNQVPREITDLTNTDHSASKTSKQKLKSSSNDTSSENDKPELDDSCPPGGPKLN